MFIVFDWLAAISKQDLLRVPGSFQEIERIASTYVLPFVWADPLARLARRCRLLKRRVSALARFLPSEPLSIFRQLFCREALASDDADELFSELCKLSKTAFKAEWAILLDSALAHKFQKDDQASKSLGSPFDLVCALQTGNMTGKHHRLSLALCALTIRDDQKMGSPWDHLRIAVEEGLDRATLSGLQFLSERDLREAIREFTPFEEGGLGTFYQLRSIRQIDELFLLSSQMLLYFERDLLREP